MPDATTPAGLLERLSAPLAFVARVAIILVAFVALGSGITCFAWMLDTGPLLELNPAPGAQRILNPRVHPGDFIYTSRSVRILESCPVEIGIWIANATGEPIYPRGEYRSFITAGDAFRATPVGYEVPARLPPGEYQIQNYLACQANPLTLKTASLPGLHFTVVAPGDPL